jgi:filamentous hemagglutinin
VFGDLQSPTSLHAFGYANGNPLLFVDPLGEAGKLFRQDVEKLTREEKEAAARLIDAFWASSAAQSALKNLRDDQIVAVVCGAVPCEEGDLAYAWERTKRWASEHGEPVLQQIASSPAAEAIRAVQAKAAKIDEDLRDTATGAYRQALAPTVNAVASSNTRPVDAAPQVLAQAERMSRNLGDATVDAAEEAAKNYAIGAVLKGGGAALEARAARREAKAVAAEARAAAGAEAKAVTAEARAAAGAEAKGARFAASQKSLWTAGEFEGKRVYRRSDLIDPSKVDKFGRTNLERMREGLAPLGPDGKPMNLHHMLQTPNGPVAEVTQTFHQEYREIIHINPNTIPSGIDRKAFDRFRERYWINRAKDFR